MAVSGSLENGSSVGLHHIRFSALPLVLQSQNGQMTVWNSSPLDLWMVIARMAFRAAALRDFKDPVYVLPMSNHYTNYFSVQGQLVMTIGEPIDISYLYDTYKTDPATALKIA